MKKLHFKSMILGALILAVIYTLAIPAVALITKSINVATGVSVYIDDLLLEPTDANGKATNPFIYNGTTYLPVRAISKALGIPIQWDGKTQSVYVGKHDSEEPAVMLADLDCFYYDGFFKTVDSHKDNLGNIHRNAVVPNQSYAEEIYVINGKYSSIKGCFYLWYNLRDCAKGTLQIYGDKKLLYVADVAAGVYPIEFDVDITGVLELTVKVDGNCSNGVGIGECGLYT